MVIAANLNMPKACIDCEYPLCDYYNTEWNRAGNSSINYTNSRAINCPLKPISEIEVSSQEEHTHDNV